MDESPVSGPTAYAGHPVSPELRPWISDVARARELDILGSLDLRSPQQASAAIERLASENGRIHDDQCINLNPASNVMNPRAERLLSAGLGSRASLGNAGEKYEMGLEAIEEIEVIATRLVSEVFDATFAEVRVPSGAIANLYAFIATCKPGDTIIVPPSDVAGHVTHQQPGAAGLYGLRILEAPYDARRYSVDIDGLRELAKRERPRLITMGASLNLVPHPVREVRAIADEVGADLLFDAAHACGMFAGRQWPNPLAEGADLMTMSTYKSLGGPAGGLVLTNRADLAERVDAIAYPGLTANFDPGRVAALGVTMVDWLRHGQSYARMMCDTAAALAHSLADTATAPFTVTGPQGEVATMSHQFALDATSVGGGHEAALQLRGANVLASAIGLPGRGGVGLRLGVPEAVRWGLTPALVPELAACISAALQGNPEEVAPRVTALRRSLQTLCFMDL
jgi:glycine hydroxymethyltransferase